MYVSAFRGKLLALERKTEFIRSKLTAKRDKPDSASVEVEVDVITNKISKLNVDNFGMKYMHHFEFELCRKSANLFTFISH